MQTEVTPHRSRVLIIEDESLIAEDLTERLLCLGHTVIGCAASAEGGIAMATRERPTLVLVDIRLKGERDGIDAVKEIRCQLDVPVIYISAHSDVPTLNRVRETEYDGFILKPFYGRQLSAEIEMAMLRYDQRINARREAGNGVAHSLHSRRAVCANVHR